MINMEEAEALLKEIDTAELEKPIKDIIEIFGIETAFKLSQTYGGQMKYFPKPEEFFKTLVKARIKTEYSAGNISMRKLAEKYGVSRNTVRKWINKW